MLGRLKNVLELQEVADGIYHFESKLPVMTNLFTVYIIKERAGVVIEPGPAALVPRIQEAMRKLGMNDLAYIVPTHIHVDHAGGMGKLAQLYPGAKVLVHPAGLKHAVDPSRLIESTRKVFGENFEAGFGPILPVPESQVKVPRDGEIITVDGRELQIIYAPGHAPHHMVIFDRSVKGIFCGDALGLPQGEHQQIPLPAASPPNFDLEIYLETMERLRKMGARILFYPRGGVIGHDVDSLILQAEENTRILGDIILKTLRDGGTIQDVNHEVRQYAAKHFHMNLAETELALIIGGYEVYYKKKGLL
jgi:glyoxylase-like metal-dependent hydrolase (beta-lactamase superfamily II)